MIWVESSFLSGRSDCAHLSCSKPEVMVIPNIGIGSWCADSFLMAFQGFISQLQAAKMTFQCSNSSDCKNSKCFKVTAWWEASSFQKLTNYFNYVENTLIIIKMVFYWAHIAKKQNKEKWTGALAQWNLIILPAKTDALLYRLQVGKRERNVSAKGG